MKRILKLRTMSALVDLFWLGIVGTGLFCVLAVIFAIWARNSPDPFAPLFSILLAIFWGTYLTPIVATFIEGLGWDMGRRTCGLSLIGNDGLPIGHIRRISRTVGKYLVLLICIHTVFEFWWMSFVFVGLNGMVCLFTPNKRSLLDRVFGTSSVELGPLLN